MSDTEKLIADLRYWQEHSASKGKLFKAAADGRRGEIMGKQTTITCDKCGKNLAGSRYNDWQQRGRI